MYMDIVILVVCSIMSFVVGVHIGRATFKPHIDGIMRFIDGKIDIACHVDPMELLDRDTVTFRVDIPIYPEDLSQEMHS